MKAPTATITANTMLRDCETDAAPLRSGSSTSSSPVDENGSKSAVELKIGGNRGDDEDDGVGGINGLDDEEGWTMPVDDEALTEELEAADELAAEDELDERIEDDKPPNGPELDEDEVRLTSPVDEVTFNGTDDKPVV